MPMKYIRCTEIGVVIFSQYIDHNVMFNTIKLQYPDIKVVSAGQVGTYDEDSIQCFGDSFTLGVSADKEKDSQFIGDRLAV